MDRCPVCSHPYGARRRCYICNGRPRTGEVRTCKTCGRKKYFADWQLRNGEGKFCSYPCKYKAQRGREVSPGGRYVALTGYVLVKVGIRKYKFEHRIVMEKVLGRPLKPSEYVHHINHVKTDNRPANLMVLSNSEHQALHDLPQRRPHIKK